MFCLVLDEKDAFSLKISKWGTIEELKAYLSSVLTVSAVSTPMSSVFGRRSAHPKI